MPVKVNPHYGGIQKSFILGGLLVLLVALGVFASPFMATLLISGVMVVAVYPVHRWLHQRIKFSSTFSALISLILVAIVILVPLTLLFFLIAEEAAQAYLLINEKLAAYSQNPRLLGSIPELNWLRNVAELVSNYVPISSTDVISAGRDFIGRISSALLGQTTSVLKNLTVFIIHIVVFLLSMFYFLKDGNRLVAYVNDLLPLPQSYRKALMSQLNQLSYGMIYGVFGAAVVQGLLVGIGFSIVGVNNPAFWGAIAALFSPFPYIGTAIVWLPVVIALLFTQKWLMALFLLFWGAIVVGMADNLVKPFLIGSSAALHPLAILVVLLGGAFSFGVKGLIFGPFILTLALAFLHIYSLEYAQNPVKKSPPSRKRRPPSP